MDLSQAHTWRSMVEQCEALLTARTGRPVSWWVQRARDAGKKTEAELESWLKSQGATGYAQYPVHWELFGYPPAFDKGAQELLDQQYRDRPALHSIAEKLLTTAQSLEGVTVHMRGTYISLMSPRRKCAQINPTTKTAVDLILRTCAPPNARLELMRSSVAEHFDKRVRIRTVEEVDDEILALLKSALEENT